MNRQSRRAAEISGQKQLSPIDLHRVTSLTDQAMTSHRAGRLEDATRLYRKVLKRDPNNIAALSLLADVMQLTGKPEKAGQLARQALGLNPDMPGALLILANSLHKSGNADEAIENYEAALKIKPDYTDAMMALATILREKNELNRALDLYDEVLGLRPDLAEAHFNFANALCADDRCDEAIDAYEEAIRLKPGMAAAYANLAGALHIEDQTQDALKAAVKSLELSPNLRSGLINQGNILRSIEKFAEAECSYRNLLAHNSKDAVAHDLLGNVCQDQGRLDEACAFYRTALELDPSYDLARGDLSITLLSKGELVEGWALYEARFSESQKASMRSFGDASLWRGEPLAGDDIVLWKEQGIGDDLRFASCYPDAIDRAAKDGATCIIETDPRLVALYQRSFPRATVSPEGRKPPKDIKYHAPAGALPKIFRSTIEDFPERSAYLIPDPDRTKEFAEELAGLGDDLKIGIAWRSRNLSSERTRHYTQLEDWAPFFALPGIQLVNLQYNNADEELETARTQFGASIHQVKNLDLMNDLDGAAALTSALDLVVSAPVSVADMAGALGVPTILYGPKCHPMTLGTGTLPWHPSTIFIGKAWDEPMTRIISQVVDLVRQKVEAI